MGDLREVGDARLLVNELPFVQISKLAAVKSNPEVRSKHPLVSLLQKNHNLDKSTNLELS